jgi:hypothetical protein
MFRAGVNERDYPDRKERGSQKADRYVKQGLDHGAVTQNRDCWFGQSFRADEAFTQ